jgi:hypothetical protein
MEFGAARPLLQAARSDYQPQPTRRNSIPPHNLPVLPEPSL